MVSKPTTTVESVLAKSLISQTLQNARASLMNPKRPDTPEQSRHLFSSGEYSGNRPGSAYNVESLVSQALDDLNQDLASNFCKTKHVGRQHEPVPKKRIKLKQKKFAPTKVLEEVKKVTETIEEAKEGEEEDFEQAFEKQFEKMLEEDIEQSIQCDSENLEESATEEYKRAKEQLKQFLKMDFPAKPEAKKDEEESDALEDESEEYYKKLKASENESLFEKKYNELVDCFTELSRKKVLEEESKGVEKSIILTRRVMKDWSAQSATVKEKCSRETILKGLLFLMNTRNTELLLELCECGIVVFLSLYSSYKSSEERPPDFYYIFNSLLNVVKILYKCSKEPANDSLFRSGTALDESVNITNLFIPKEERVIFVGSASKVLEMPKAAAQKSVVVKNENNAYELLLFLLGTYKNLSIAKENRAAMVDKGVLAAMLNLLKSLTKAEDELKDKLPQCLVQITGTVRNLLGDTGEILSSTLRDIVGVLKKYNASHSELSLNCLRILSKASLNIGYATEILKSGCCNFLVELLQANLDKPFVFVRIAFILGNLTMLFGTACTELYNNPKAFDIVYGAMLYYLGIWKQKEAGKPLEIRSKGAKTAEEFVKHFNNDVVVKAIRLCANLWISEELAKRELSKISEATFVSLLSVASVELNEANEDLVLNALSCLSNILFFFPAVSKDLAEVLLKRCKAIFPLTTNLELRIECFRIWANLSRDSSLTPLFVEAHIADSVFETLTGLKMDQREAFYAVGLMINLSGDEKIKEELYGPRIEVLLQKLEGAGLEDPELAKNLCKLLVNLCDKKAIEKNKWSNEQIEKADKILSGLAEECDSLLDVANEQEKEIINELHKIVNNLINVLPEVMFSCNAPNCGRKFKSPEELAQHVARRHVKSNEIKK